MQNYRGQNFRGGYQGNSRNEDLGGGRSRSRERQYSSNFRRNNQGSSRRSRSDSRASTDRDRIRCFKCREYDHFTKDCPNSDAEKVQSEQIQQMFNLDEDKTSLKVLIADTYDDLIRTNSDDTIDYLNL